MSELAMKEARIENKVERTMDNLDYQYLRDLISTQEYNQKVMDLNRWAEEEYKKLR